MRNPVLPLNDYISFLQKRIKSVADDIAAGPTPQDLKMKSSEAVIGSKGKRVVALKDAVDIITEQSYNKGQFDVLSDLLDNAEQLLKQYQEANTNGTV